MRLDKLKDGQNVVLEKGARSGHGWPPSKELVVVVEEISKFGYLCC